MNKQEFYKRGDIVGEYDNRRFGGRSGAHVNERELSTVASLLPPPGGKLLDIPVGTGRLSLHLRELGYDCHGMDYSETMLELSRKRGLSQLAQGDIFDLDVPPESFDCAVSLRFYFHFKDPSRALASIHRALKAGGIYVLDTFNRSPRAWLPFLGEEGRVHLHPPALFEQEARKAGFDVVKQEACYVFSPLVYRFLPFPVVRALDRVEEHLPDPWLTRVFWKLAKR